MQKQKLKLKLSGEQILIRAIKSILNDSAKPSDEFTRAKRAYIHAKVYRRLTHKQKDFFPLAI